MIYCSEEKLIQREYNDLILLLKLKLILSLKLSNKSIFPMLDMAHPFLHLTFLSNLDLTTLLTHLWAKVKKFLSEISLKLSTQIQ